MDRRDSLKKGLLGGVAALLSPGELAVRSAGQSGKWLKPLTMKMAVPTQAIALATQESIQSSLQEISSRSAFNSFSEMSLESVPEDDFYVTVTKLDKVYYYENERLITE